MGEDKGEARVSVSFRGNRRERETHMQRGPVLPAPPKSRSSKMADLSIVTQRGLGESLFS